MPMSVQASRVSDHASPLALSERQGTLMFENPTLKAFRPEASRWYGVGSFGAAAAER